MRKLLILTFLLVGSQGFCQTPWSLSDCISYALEHNLTVKSQELNVQLSGLDYENAKAARLPSLGASASENFSFGRGLTADNTYANHNTTSTSFSVGSEVPVFQGFQIKYNIARNRLNLQAATADLAKTKDNIIVAVAQAYMQVLYAEEIQAVAGRQVEIDSLQVERLSNRLQQGKTSRSDLSRQEAALSASRATLVQAVGNVQIAVLELTQLLELPSPEGFTVRKPEIEPVMLQSPEAIYNEAVQLRPAVKVEEYRLDAADAGIGVAKSAFLPSLSLSGGFGTNFYTLSGAQSLSFTSQMKDNFSQYLGLSLSLPIFNRFSSKNNLRAAKLSYKMQEIQLESTKKALYREIQQAYYNALNSQAKHSSAKAAEESAKDAFDLVLAKYEAGKAGITEFNEARSEWMKARSDLVQAYYENLFQCRLLDFYRTGTITLE